MTNQHKYPSTKAKAGKHPKDLKPSLKKQNTPADPRQTTSVSSTDTSQHPIVIYYFILDFLTLLFRVPVAPVETKGGLFTPTVEGAVKNEKNISAHDHL